MEYRYKNRAQSFMTVTPDNIIQVRQSFWWVDRLTANQNLFMDVLTYKILLMQHLLVTKILYLKCCKGGTFLKYFFVLTSEQKFK